MGRSPPSPRWLDGLGTLDVIAEGRAEKNGPTRASRRERAEENEPFSARSFRLAFLSFSLDSASRLSPRGLSASTPRRLFHTPPSMQPCWAAGRGDWAYSAHRSRT